MPFTAPPPRSALGRHRQLAPSAAVRVSPLCLGAMTFGDANSQSLGKCDKDTSFKIMDRFFELGGNFIDTANGYQNGESEERVGEWMKARNNRDQIVLATKYTTFYKGAEGDIIGSNFAGNNAKSLKVSVRDSLAKLQTTYIDLLYVHWFDYTTDVAELMHSLNNLVVAGTVLYLGISDTPAWFVSSCNAYARAHGLRQFSVYQGLWNAGMRDLERDILPMTKFERMAVVPWGPVGQGRFQTEEEFARREKAGEGRTSRPVTDKDRQVSKCLEKVGREHNATIQQIALAYISQKAPYVFPIFGTRNVEYLDVNARSLDIHLTDADMAKIDGAYDFDYGFPHTFLFQPFEPTDGAFKAEDVGLLKPAGTFDWVAEPRAIGRSAS